MTIEFDIWINNFIGVAEFIASPKIVREVWLSGNRSITSMMNFEEMYMQFIDGLDMDHYLQKYTNQDYMSSEQAEAAKAFVEYFCLVDKKYFQEHQTKVLESIFSTTDWKLFEEAAKNVTNLWPKNFS